MLTAGMHRTAFAALRQAARPAFSAAPLPAVLRPATVAGTRMLSMTPLRWSEKKGEETARPATGAPSDAAPSSDKTRATEADSEASRAALWDQMLNTIIVDPVDSANADARLRKPRDALGSGLDAWSSSDSASGLSTSIMDQLESEFRARPTIGPAKPATTTTGRSVSAANSYGNNSAAMLYRNLMGTLRRNNVRRELRLEERYEKPNQKRRRLRSERHRRRFADMIRKKVQLRGEYLPEDPTPAMWQRVAQLIAGTIATGSLVYFVLFADFGEGEHCFMPIRRALNVDPEVLRKLLETSPPQKSL